MEPLLRVNKNRLEFYLEEISKFGKTELGGVTRVTLSDEDRRAREQLKEWFEALGCEIHIDPIGNMFAVHRGKNRSLAPVITGSHSDSQPRGGKFDGMLGIIAGLEIVHSLQDHDIELERDLVVINWTNEEGARFSPGCTGSGVWAGKLKLEDMYQIEDRDGTTFVHALKQIGFKGESDYSAFPPHAAFELHIEQGPVLDREQVTIGIPDGIAGLRWYDVEITGMPNHAGSTPMDNRHDALLTFSKICQKINEIACATEGTVATIGEVHVQPNSRNVIPGAVSFTIDIRGWDEQVIDGMCNEVDAAMQEIAEQEGCQAVITGLWKERRAEFDDRLIAIVRDASEALGLNYRSLVSGAFHDMLFINQVAPGAMIFVPSIGGISHSELENTRVEDYTAGADVLFNCIVKTANESDSR